MPRRQCLDVSRINAVQCSIFQIRVFPRVQTCYAPDGIWADSFSSLAFLGDFWGDENVDVLVNKGFYEYLEISEFNLSVNSLFGKICHFPDFESYFCL